jgi:DNA polymerase/3'-5' exonuclease PolX
MSTGQRIPLDEALMIANHFIEHIASACDQIYIAGSIRRQRPEVGDIEIVAVPSIQEMHVDLFSEVVERVDLLDRLLNEYLADGVVQKRVSEKGATAWGKLHKRLIFDGAPVDLFCAEADRLGVILAIRTGPAEYSHALVSGPNVRLPRGRVGLLPERFRVQDGWLTYRVSGQRIPTPTEEGFFSLIGVPYQEPPGRGALAASAPPPTADAGAEDGAQL